MMKGKALMMQVLRKVFPRIGVLIIIPLVALSALNLYAQEATPELNPPAEATEAPVVTALPSEAPTLEVSQAPTSAPELATALPSDGIAPEPALSLLVREFFDNGDVSPWILGAAWSLVVSENGQALQVFNSAEALELQKGSFYNLAVQARFLSVSGEARLSIRNSAAGHYTASLNPNGTVQLYRGDVLLQSTTLAPAVLGQWRTLRISAVDAVLRVSIDNSEVLVFEDSAALPLGTIRVAANFSTAEAANTLLLDDFFVWVPAAELANYPAPTPYLAPTSVVTAAPEATAEVEVSLTPSEVVAEGKDYSPFPPPTAEEIANANSNLSSSLGNDNFSGYYFNSLPFIISDNTIGDTLEIGETTPTCGYGIANTVWFNFTAPATASYRLSTIGSNFDTILGLYDVSGTSQVACNDDASLTSLASQFTVNLSAGSSYTIQLGGFNGRYGLYMLRVEQLGLAAPSVPTLLSPANAFKTNDTTPALTWNTASNVYQYEVQWATNATFTANLQSALVTEPTTSFTLPTLPNTMTTVYYWRLRAINGSGVASAFSLVRNFTLDTTVPTAPNLNAPADTAIVTNSQPALTWAAVTGATGYYIEIDDANDFLTPITPDTLVSTTSYTPPLSLPQGTYYWRVQAQDVATNLSVESTVRSFTIKILTAPVNNAVIFTTGTASPVFRWTAVAQASGYYLQIDTDNDFTNGVLHNINAALATTYTMSALPAGVYYWQVLPTDREQATAVYSQFTISPPALAAASLLSPANAAITNDTTPDVVWNTVPNAVQYEVQWATNATFTVNMQSALVTDPTNLLTLPTLPDTAGTVYYWRVRSINSVAVAGAYSAARTFTLDMTAPNVPNLSAPADLALSTNSRPALTWVAVTGASGYYIEIDDANDFISPIIPDTLVATTSFTPPNSLPQGIYYWRVQAQDAANNLSAESTVRSFTIKILTAPANNAVIFANTGSAAPTLTWTAVMAATGYTVQISTTSDFSNIVQQMPPALVTSYTVTPALPTGIYYWQVIPTDFEQVAPVYSQFTISPAALAAPSLVSPANAAITNDTTPDLLWNTVPDAAQYEVQWATNSAFTLNMQSALVADPTTNLTLPTLPDTAGTVYYWRVRSLNSLNVAGAYSAARTFTLDTTVPTAPNLNAPADTAIVTNSRPPLTWAAVTGASGYYIEIDDANDFLTPIIPDTLVTTTSYTPTSSLPQGSYYWRVQAQDAATNLSAESTVRSFTIKILTAPANNAVIFTNTGSAAPVLRWITVTGASGYMVQIATTSDFNPLNIVREMPPALVTSYTVAPALPTGIYYWQVIPTGVEQTAPVYSQFTISPTALVAPVLVNPVNAAKTNDTTPNLDWDLVQNAAQYELQWATNSAFTQNFQNTFVTDPLGNADLPTLPNTASTTYYWRIRAINSLGVAGAWSVTRNFILDTVAPNAPVLSLPSNGSLTTTNPVSFKWLAVTGAFRYELRYGTTNPPTIVISNLASTSYLSPSPMLMQTYYWQVRAIDVAGNASAWSTMREVKINSGTSAAPILNRYTTLTPTLAWTPLSWTSSGGYYQVHVDNNNNFSSPEFLNNNISSAAPIVTTSALSNGTWYWRVRACTSANVCGAWSTTGVFIIEN